MNNTDVHFPLIHNGMDYLITVGEALRATDEQRGMKYAVLNLHAATELLLKWPLMQRDWQLVALRHTPGDGLCSEKEFLAGHCRTIDADAACRLLRSELKIEIRNRDKRTIKNLSERRNRLQHFQITERVEIVKPLVEKVLSFLLDFIHDHIRDHLDTAEAAHVDKQMAQVREVVHEIETFANTRMERLRPELEAETCPVLECPACERWAAVVSGDVTTSCRFCRTRWTSEEVAGEYAYEILHRSEMGEHGEEAPVLNCPECDIRTFVRSARLNCDDTGQDFCFNCAESFPAMLLCVNGGCDTPVPPEQDLCDECFGNLL